MFKLLFFIFIFIFILGFLSLAYYGLDSKIVLMIFFVFIVYVLSEIEIQKIQKYELMKITITCGGILFLSVLGFLLPSWSDSMVGRDFRPQAMNSAMMIFIQALLMRLMLNWSAKVLIVSLIPIEALLMLVIMWGTGSYSVDLSIINSFLYTNMFFAMPWVIGIIIGSILNYFKKA